MKSSRFIKLTALCVLLGSVRLWWPADIPFVHDEPQLIERALNANASGEIARFGLRGTRGVAYGPFPLWFYQAALRLTHRLPAVVLLKAALITGATIVAILVLFTLFPHWPLWMACVPLLSPYLWFYARDLWDNSLLTGLSALALAAYFAFVRTHRPWLWFSAWGLTSLAWLTHLMALPLAGALALHALVFERLWLRQHWKWVIAAGLFCLTLSSGYAQFLAQSPSQPTPWGFRPASYFFALYGARLFSALALEYFLGWWWFVVGPKPISWIVGLCIGMTAFAFIPTFYGMILCFKRLYEAWKGRVGWDVNNQLYFILGVLLVLHFMVVGANGLVSHPHYYNAIWYAFFALFCIGMNQLASKAWARGAGALYLAGLSVSYFWLVGLIHWQQGNRELRFGTTLGNQMAIASTICRYPNVPIVDERAHSALLGISVLKTLIPCQGEGLSAQSLHLRYKEAAPSARVQVIAE